MAKWKINSEDPLPPVILAGGDATGRRAVLQQAGEGTTAVAKNIFEGKAVNNLLMDVNNFCRIG